MATTQEIAQAIADHVRSRGGSYSDWYVGVAADPRTRLFNDHGVDEDNGCWIYQRCANSDEAREVEDHFISNGMKGGPGGGDSTTKSVYAYKIATSTRE